MTKNEVIAFGVITLVTVALTGCNQTKPTTSDTPATGGTTPTTEAKQDSGSMDFTGTMKDIMGKGKSYTCTMTSLEGKDKTEGTLFLDGERVFTNMKTVEKQDGKEKTVNANALILGKEMYIWETGGKEGLKMAFNEEDMNKPETPDTTADADNVSESNKLTDEKMDYKCSEWSVDEAKFTVPSEVTFQDLSEMFKQFGEMGKTKPE